MTEAQVPDLDVAALACPPSGNELPAVRGKGDEPTEVLGRVGGSLSLRGLEDSRRSQCPGI
jgi:hypothetical protein